ncbi:MAG: 7-cyano-7-deazaguanine synthase QueC [Desulfobacterales bacterium]|nr:7-cyano-7-deazaguanine synthase QueC [Desulfobacterales bacterium]
MAETGKAVVLLSGGLDSATTLAIAVEKGFNCYAMSFDYGQRHRFELAAAKKIADRVGAIKHLVLPIGIGDIGGSALTADIAVPKERSDTDMAASIPVTYVPARNTVFLSCALAWAETLGAEDIYIGVNAVDYSGYPDCRPEFIKAFEHMANLATKASVEGDAKIRIQAPLLYFTKAEIIKKGISLNVDYSITHSCYDPSPEGLACGQCDSCRLRKKGFAEAGLVDPTSYIEE